MHKAIKTKGCRSFIFIILIFTMLTATGFSAGQLEILPTDDFESSGLSGGPFEPGYKEYYLQNTGDETIVWGLLETNVEWIDIDPQQGWGFLDPNQITTITISINSRANDLQGGVFTDTLTFISGQQELTREVILTVIAPAGVLEITPLEDFEPYGEPGGPFDPEFKKYKLENTGGTTLIWGISFTQDWLEVDSTFGQLDPNSTEIITVSLKSSTETMAEGIYTDTLTFSDITDPGNIIEHTRDVTLTIEHVGGIWISPDGYNVEVIEGGILSEILTIGNDGQENIDFMITTHVVSNTEQATANMAEEIPLSHDFTKIENLDYKPGELMIRFASPTLEMALSMAENAGIEDPLAGATITREYSLVPGLNLVELPEGMTMEEALQKYNNTPGILYAQPNYRVHALSTFPNDTRFDDLWGLHNTAQDGGIVDADIDAPEAWDISSSATAEVVVAVIDTGVDYTHPDLAANMWTNLDELNGTAGVDDDENGYIDDIYGFDFDHYDSDPMDDNYHGTHCAGTIGAVTDNNEGVAGVIGPSNSVKIMAVKFLDSNGDGWASDAVLAVEYATAMGARIMSNSWGGGGYDQPLEDAINAAEAKGILFVAAAGNDYGSNNDSNPHYPSSYTADNIIAVLSTDQDDGMSNFSNYGPTSVDIGAPGNDILSCDLGGGYRYLDGTSMATPHVSGACAVLLSMNPMLSYQEVKDIILGTVDPTLNGLCLSGGRLNLYNAVQEVQAPWIEIIPDSGTIAPSDTNDISVIFNALELEPGTYQAEIAVSSSDPRRPSLVIPVTCIVNPDNLEVVPETDFESSGVKEGPFMPECTTYILSNVGSESISWQVEKNAEWLNIGPGAGVLDPNETIAVNVCIDPNASVLEPGIYTDSLMFHNLNSGFRTIRNVTLTVNPPDIFTESFDHNDNDLEYSSITFMPNGMVSYYQACKSSASGFTIDPNGGSNKVMLGDDDYLEIVLSDNKEIVLYGIKYDRLYIGSNGYITFSAGDFEYESMLDNHFALPRISGFFADLTPANSNNITYKQLDDRFVVSYIDVPLYGDKDSKNSFQIEMFFADESIRITWQNLSAKNGIVGLSEGLGVPGLFEESNLSEYINCCQCGDFDGDEVVDFEDFAILAGRWMDADCGMYDWCQWTDIDKSGSVDVVDIKAFGNNWLYGADSGYDWSQPALLVELNDDEGNTARLPHLSRDRLSIYISRLIPSLGHECIVKATRSTPDDQFTSERILTELIVEHDNVVGAWLSEDGQRLYYNEAIDGGGRLKMAELSGDGETWIPIRSFDELYNYYGEQRGSQCSLTANELTIFYQSRHDLYTATRTEPNGLFSNVRRIDELNSDDVEYAPRISANGLIIYFDSNRDGSHDLYKATRLSIDGPFSNIEKLSISTDTYNEMELYITPEKDTLLFKGDIYGDGIYVSHWEKKSDYEETCLPK